MENRAQPFTRNKNNLIRSIRETVALARARPNCPRARYHCSHSARFRLPRSRASKAHPYLSNIIRRPGYKRQRHCRVCILLAQNCKSTYPLTEATRDIAARGSVRCFFATCAPVEETHITATENYLQSWNNPNRWRLNYTAGWPIFPTSERLPPYYRSIVLTITILQRAPRKGKLSKRVPRCPVELRSS